MQKLVKKTRYYQTLVPVEAYEGEGDDWQDEISLALTVAGGALAFSNPWVGVTIAGAGVVNHFFYDEIVDAVEATAEALEEVETTVRRRAGEFSDAIADGIEAVSDALDLEDVPLQWGNTLPIQTSDD